MGNTLSYRGTPPRGTPPRGPGFIDLDPSWTYADKRKAKRKSK